MNDFLSSWGESAYTSIGFFWSALWVFALGYLVSSMIQVFVTHQKMKETMGSEGSREMALGAFFGFISSSCSFAALATTKSLFKKGAGFTPALAFLLASTNLVIELGIVIAVFLPVQFVVGEYVGGILLIIFMWIFVKITRPERLVKKARERLSGGDDDQEGHGDMPPLKERIREKKLWGQVGQQYLMEWNMVWKDVTIGFTVAGIISAFVPRSFFETLFIGTGQSGEYGFFQILEHILVGPLAAFMTFIGSMGNIPLASVLFANGVSFAGVMAFIFSDLVVFPVLRINARYYGWKMSFYILLTLLFSLVGTTLLLYYGMELLHVLPEAQEQTASASQQEHFKLNYTFYLNIVFVLLSGLVVWFKQRFNTGHHGHHMANKGKVVESILRYVAYLSFAWLVGGLLVYFI